MVIVFDLVGTLFSLGKVEQAFSELGMRPEAAKWWFARLLQSAMAATLANRYTPFLLLAEASLQQVLKAVDRPESLAAGILEQMKELDPWPEAAQSLQQLRGDGHRLIVLTNSSVEAAERLLQKAGVLHAFEAVLSADETDACKPDPRTYRAAAFRAGSPVSESCLVAAHGWDVLGAHAVGMKTVWIEREEKLWGFPGDPPGLAVPTLAQLPAAIKGIA